MRLCCVPKCSSSLRRRVQAVSFHEMPSGSSLSDQWLKANSRKDWGPASNPVVCSLHFLTADFRKDCKKRLLKPGAVPSVFDKQESCTAHADATTEAAKQGSIFRRAIAAKQPFAFGSAFQGNACGTQVDVVPGKPEPNENRNEATSEELARSRGGQRRRKVCAKRSWQTQTTVIPSSSTLFIQRKRWRERERSLKAKNDRLRKTIDAYKQELEILKEECHVRTFHEVAWDAEKGILKAQILLDQVKNYSRKKPQWSVTTIRHCIVLHNLSAKAYEYLRSEEVLRLPCRKTLRKYIGSVSDEVGFNQLVRCRLEAELQALCTPQSKVCSLIVDEMRIRQKLEYHKQRDAFVGDVDMGSELEHLTPISETETLANSVLCFVLCGLHAKYKIPVGYFFTKGCTGEQLKEVIDHVVQKTTDIGFDNVRVVPDNHRMNVTAMQILCQGDANITAPHPADSSNSIFLSFDQSHIIKNIRSQFLAKDIGGTKEISSKYIKMLYKMQRNSTVKPISETFPVRPDMCSDPIEAMFGHSLL
ncbi:hypothetical protein HPB49_022917 [Dermacentor silvarum]|uniref:Uncharacterized protein n=1 Tax=Dermacentor silvarum TaxID=543639 RepID=A0ACB8DRU6_DERSI|nr:hypothetical protein HPB49_022917 [Dermacentor silvarum]